ncbi:2-oxo acid dehydrogenase subunit E2 [bacterium]|nr:2-oxo acid dehydrogenase subunit E2 [bacterium]
MATEVKLPELGENISSGDVVKVLVSVGDTVEVDQPLLELETDKASFDVPSTAAGTVKEIKVEEGGQAEVGKTIMIIEESGNGGADSKGADDQEDAKAEADKKDGKMGKDGKDEDGGASSETSEEAEEKATPSDKSDDAAKSAPASKSAPAQESGDASSSAPISPAPGPSDGTPVPAAPSVRMLARELGVDITQVRGSGPGGRITDDDVKKHTKSIIQRASTSQSASVSRPSLPDFSAFGETEVEEMSKVRRRTAEQMEISWSIPVVTQHDRADVTHLEELRKSWSKRAEKAGTKLTVTAIALKIAAAALKKFPQFNASIDMEQNRIIYKKYYHLGVAVDTERGLLVPVLRDVDKKNILEISSELQELATKAREKKIKPDEMQGASFTITNLGGIGGTSFTPIINAPEVAILGMSRGSIEPVWTDGEFKPRMMLPLSLTYDHRIIDGADAARFLRWIAEAMEEPLLMALEG